MIQKEYVHASFCTGITACELAAMWMDGGMHFLVK